MCGIAGVVFFESGRAADAARLKRMAAALRHRGPDDEGFYQSAGVGFAHRRLSIIDLSGGKQPLSNEDQTVWTICNGEIFNYKDLAKDLTAKGHHLKTQSDCEVLAHLYEQYGEGFVEKLRGQFALALWDDKRKTLVLARDHVGEKPLYVYQDAEKIIFASELKAIVAYGDLSLDLNWSGLGHYLKLGYFPNPSTHILKIQKIKPAHFMVMRNGKVDTAPYWTMPRPTEATGRQRFEDICDELHEQVLEATKIRLMSDVPLGAFLSGGVDSSLIVALMTQATSATVKTFSIAFGESAYNEAPYARRVADQLHTEHHEIAVDYKIRDLIEQILTHFDEPFADSSAIPQYLVCQAARRHVTVAISGDAGDEFFGGYTRFVARKLAAIFLQMPSGFRRTLEVSLQGLWGPRHLYSGPARGPIAKALRFIRLAHYYEEHPAASTLPFFDAQLSKALLGEDLWRRQEYVNPLQMLFGEPSDVPLSTEAQVARHMYVDQNSYLTDDILVKVDRMSMIHALEVRSPLLDCRLIEWAARLPLDLKVRGFQTKYALKRLAEKWIPRDIVHRPKQGFAVPIPQWFRGELRGYVRDELASTRLNFLQRTAIERILTEHEQGQCDWSQQIWALLSLKAAYIIPV